MYEVDKTQRSIQLLAAVRDSRQMRWLAWDEDWLKAGTWMRIDHLGFTVFSIPIDADSAQCSFRALSAFVDYLCRPAT